MNADAANEDREQLRLLAIFHYVVAGIMALFSCFPVIHLAIGIAMLSGAFPMKNADEATAATFAGLMFVIIASVIIVFGWSCAFAVGFAGRMLSKQTRYTFCLIMAGIECMFMPLGTILGVFTIVVLMRPSVKSLFHAGDTGVWPASRAE